MKTINYKSDFKIVEEFSDGSSLFNSPFTFTYYTKPSTQYVVIYDGENYINCRPLDEGKLLVIFDNHNLSTGVLKVKREFRLTDSDFSDNTYTKIIEQELPIILEKGTQCSCNNEEEIHIEIPVAYQMGGGASLEEVNYNELKELRDSNNLIPGSSYRITDYVTTVAGLDLVKSANHPFDIIVTAISSNELSEDAKAILHEGDEYFAKCQLNAWELKYCLDNDTNRFTWADPENGKGVVWYMKDESNNSAYYDFKSVQVREKKDSNDWYYTLSVYYTDTQEDFSVAKYDYNGKGCVSNTIDIQHLANSYNKVTINYNTIIADARPTEGEINIENYNWRSVYNHIGIGCSHIKVTKAAVNNIFGSYCSYITFIYASNVTFGEQNQYIYFHSMDDTVFGPYISNFKFVKEDGSYANVASSRIETNFNSGYYISIKSANTLKNLHIKAGVANGKTQTIEIDECGNYTTTIERSATTGKIIVSKSGDNNIDTSNLVDLDSDQVITGRKTFRTIDFDYGGVIYKDKKYSYKLPNKSGTIALTNDVVQIPEIFDKEIYYNDGSNEMVPIKHPDLSTQPSILPYKFMGQYVYEQLVTATISSGSDSNAITINWPSSLDKGKIYLDIKAILAYLNGLSVAIPIKNYYPGAMRIDGDNIHNININQPIYLHVIYTSMPEEGNYYGYNNY